MLQVIMNSFLYKAPLRINAILLRAKLVLAAMEKHWMYLQFKINLHQIGKLIIKGIKGPYQCNLDVILFIIANFKTNQIL